MNEFFYLLTPHFFHFCQFLCISVFYSWNFFNTKKNHEVVFGSWWCFDQSCWLCVGVLWPWNFWICPWKYLENTLNFQLRISYAPWDHFKLKSRDGVFWWKFIKDFPSSHIHKWKKVWSRIILVHNNFFFKVSRCLLVQCTGSLLLLFFNIHIFILVDRKCWLSGHNHLYITQGHIIIYFYRYQFDRHVLTQ